MKYEYKTLNYKTEGVFGGKVNNADIEATMNQMGEEGWELVNSFPTAEAYGRTIGIISVFKRIVSNQ